MPMCCGMAATLFLDGAARALVYGGDGRFPGINGFFGASSIERLPTERAIRGQVEAFKSLKLG